VPAEEKDFNSAADTDAQFNYLRWRRGREQSTSRGYLSTIPFRAFEPALKEDCTWTKTKSKIFQK